MIVNYLSSRYDLKPGENRLPFDRLELLSVFAETGYKVGVEIGVNNGRFAQAMCERIPGLEYYGIDPYNRYDDFQIGSTGQMENSYQKAIKKIEPYNARIIKEFSALAYSQFENGSVDFVYVDGNHEFNYVISDILLWLPKIRKGGVMAGHDYLPPVKDAVDFCLKSMRIKQWFILGERDPSWFWSVE